MKTLQLNSIDLFAGAGGLTVGMHKAGFKTKAAVEIEPAAVKAYQMNHPDSKVFQNNIKNIDISEIKKILGDQQLHLLAGCPPCQGFSSIRRLNKRQSVRDDRNSLVLEYLRFVKELKPLTIMMENVPGLINYYLFKNVVKELKEIGYNPKVEIVNVKDYGVPQRRKRLVMVGSLLGNVEVSKVNVPKVTVREAIGSLKSIEETSDPTHKIVANHTPRILEMINKIPKNGGSRKDLPDKYILKCHKKENVGFNDVYGRLKWDDYSSTITGGCLNPSKGRFLHPEEDRCITAREAALIQTFPVDYKFPEDVNKTALALLIGNALPPEFSYYQSLNIRNHIIEHLS
ncbi:MULTISPECIES: DNA cytosine methyltransferase [unclassified Leeuwenhoekiella]|uniref:DNA cytosine methyltransferase n=1 Tax=unclassified Leeuwenhoekiella TaxID=2615029 RepID=UPI000C53E804|nr:MULTISPECIES: DNA cytosine methyltransferase [unclassified Leeuwenhoekiella]MAW96165.1 DNA (cytosine-5-)-methyltransferase [Leeuwenhoekiella sp.]MBA80159.1 DNA (cytosine-5-)-methyltransferase [Leeuwenhoekiella sp.]|tara:strand:- start:11123 stop:12154 length:1032 start_codon:yes stop_codon:yes gene_type:complete